MYTASYKKFEFNKYIYEYYFDPGNSLSEAALNDLSSKIRSVGYSCFNELPRYQCFLSLKGKVIVLVSSNEEDCVPIAFASGVLLPGCSLNNIPTLHLGLVCINPSQRKKGILIYMYTFLSVMAYGRLASNQKLWVSNCSADLSILKATGKVYNNVFPSPECPTMPSESHKYIADCIDKQHRKDMFIRPEVVFDDKRFIFYGSISGTVFEKDVAKTGTKVDSYYYERLKGNNEILQIGYIDFQLFNNYSSFLIKKVTN